MNNEANTDDSIESTIIKAAEEISKHLKRNGISVKDKQLVFRAYGQSEAGGKSCAIFHRQEGREAINEKIRIGSNWVSAMILDESGAYVASSSPHTLISNPEELNSYRLELKMIELAQKNDYITYIQLLNCKEKYIIGYKADRVDVYIHTDNDMTLAYTK